MQMKLEVITRHLAGRSIAENVASLRMQTSQNYIHTVMIDEVGIGIGATYMKLRSYEARGDYVMLLDDDNVLVDPGFVEKILRIAEKRRPDVFVIRAQVGERILPSRYFLQFRHVDAVNVVVSRRMWELHRGSFGNRYEGDWDFIEAVMKSRPRVRRIWQIAARTLSVSGVQSSKIRNPSLKERLAYLKPKSWQ